MKKTAEQLLADARRACEHPCHKDTGTRVEQGSVWFRVFMSEDVNQKGSYVPWLVQDTPGDLCWGPERIWEVPEDPSGRNKGSVFVKRAGSLVRFGFRAARPEDRPVHGGDWSSSGSAVLEVTGIRTQDVILTTESAPWRMTASMDEQAWVGLVEAASHAPVRWKDYENVLVARPA